MAELTLKDLKQMTNEWREFSKTLAFKELIGFIELQKEVNTTMASGPMEVYRDVHTFNGKTDLQFDFQPEKYAYLLQRSVGCDIVKTYVEDFTTTSPS